jgi:hypothetical protein
MGSGAFIFGTGLGRDSGRWAVGSEPCRLDTVSGVRSQEETYLLVTGVIG